MDAAVEREIRCIQVDPDLIPLIRASYTKEIQECMGQAQPALSVIKRIVRKLYFNFSRFEA